MVTSLPQKIDVWKGLASYDGAVYRVIVASRLPCWRDDLSRIVSKAGGYLRDIRPASAQDDMQDIRTWNLREGYAAYQVTFRPDTTLTTGALSRKPVTVIMRGNYSRIKPRDGEYQAPPKALLRPPRPSLTTPRPTGGRRYP